MDGLAISLLGPPRIERDGMPIEIDRQKAVALLAVLALEPWEHARDALAAMLWPEVDRGRGRANLRRALFSLDQALGGGHVHAGRSSIRLPSECEARIDVRRFRDLLGRCDAHGHPSNDTCDACAPQLTEAAALYRDDLLAGFTLADCPAFDEWQTLQAESLRRALAGALARLIALCEHRGAWEEAIAHARRWLALDPLHEPAHRALMLLYARSGQRAAALRQYQVCQRTLWEELGVAPSDETTRLAQVIATKELGLPPASPPSVNGAAPPMAAPAARATLPAYLTPFLGRERELASLREQVAGDPACRLLTLIGPGGAGKTRLAVELAERCGAAFPDGVWFVPLATATSPVRVPQALAEAFGLALDGRADPLGQVAAYLEDKNALLVLDNCEHLVEGGELLSRLLGRSPRLKALATSRVPLGLQGEWHARLEGLPVPSSDAPEEVRASPAAELFVRGARRRAAGFRVTAENSASIARICRSVGGLPLAIELASAWAHVLSCEEIAGEIERNLDFLSGEMRDLPERHRSLRAVFDHSWRLLSEREQAALRALSVFRGGFDREAAASVAGADLALLAALVDASLVRRQAGGRFEMLDVLRVHAAEHLATAPEEARAVRDRHAAHYIALLARHEEALWAGDQREAAARLLDEIENLRAAWRHAAERRDTALLHGGLEALFRLLQMRSWFTEGEELFAMAADVVADGAEPGRDAQALAVRAPLRQGWFALARGDVSRAEALIRAALDCSRALGATGETARALGYLSEVALARADHATAAGALQESRALFERLGDANGLAFVCNHLGTVAWALGEYAEARRLYEESVALYQGTGHRRGIAVALTNLANLAIARGQYDEAAALYARCLAAFDALGDRRGRSIVLNNLGVTAYARGDYQAAARHHEESLALKRAIGDGRGVALALNNLGDIAIQLGQHDAAEDSLRESLALARRLEDRALAARALNNLGLLAQARGDRRGAVDAFHEALRLMQGMDRAPLALDVLAGYAALLAEAGQAAPARRLAALVAAHPASEAQVRDRARQVLCRVGLEDEAEAVDAPADLTGAIDEALSLVPG